jgi:hypothetical protein
MNPKMLDLLYRSFDSALTETEEEALNDALAESPKLREERNQILKTREIVRQNPAPAFKPFFLSRLNHKLQDKRRQREDFSRSLKWSFRLVGLVGSLTVVLLFAYNSINEQSISMDSILGIPQATLEDTWQLDILGEENI